MHKNVGTIFDISIIISIIFKRLKYSVSIKTFFFVGEILNSPYLISFSVGCEVLAVHHDPVYLRPTSISTAFGSIDFLLLLY